jgi:NAD(P)-dependent dehydrogenase (short-subunit alcohol dehydrogenase family)
MRKQKSGHIFQVSSVGGRLAYGGNTPYHAAKWAVGGFSDALAMEVAPFGVKVCTLEPGGIRTNWAQRAGQNAPDLLPVRTRRSVCAGPKLRVQTRLIGGGISLCQPCLKVRNHS